ncbi:hypothetical protein [Streptomyces griseoviridis]|uniref:Helix-turn-helix domain-containing protein n=1 Tax=Streptomyces griseoviridis TaxID=45398 RepID=A0ABT9LFB5_STRGD|nr:hypothetical protein [Streptomyces griseoviridis]MDP9682395.1 hypothetical protein [Streptomyces griseoviridis]GGS81780.1 hypothetical protein GCM10010240_13920 [Streptomyces griseoviridis]
MSSDEQAPASGSVPHAFGNALAWKWSREMPTALRRGFLTLLYALRAMANASGELAFHGDRQPIRIQDIAKAAGASEKDARRYLDAAIRAGIVIVKGERKRGRPTLYVIVPTPFPDWTAAEEHLKATARKPGKAPAPWAKDTGSSGDRDPNQNGSPRPELTAGTDQEVRVTATRWSSGDRDPNGSGHRDPNNPGVTHGTSQDGAEVGFQPQVVGPPGDQAEAHEDHHDTAASDNPETWRRCRACNRPILPDPKRPGRTVHARCEPHLATTDHGRHSA